MANVLIIDDDSFIGDLLKAIVEEMGHQVVVDNTLREGLGRLYSGAFDLVLLDVLLPDGNGLESIDLVVAAESRPDVIIITAEPKAKGACMALEKNAWDYIAKPFTKDEVKLSIERALAHRDLLIAVSECEYGLDFSEILGSSPRIAYCKRKAGQCARTDANVLITGETGTGKELFANNIHKNSRLGGRDFVVVDCAALPDQLVESVLFGHVKGAFTGADCKREGLLKRADGGTLFLDEVGDMSLSIQKISKGVAGKKVQTRGGTEEIRSRFRLISATNRNLQQMQRNNQFRSDLFFRLNTVHIDLPALRDCKTDIEELVRHYTDKICNHHGLKTKEFSQQLVDIMKAYDWPGNTRELISCLESAIIGSSDSPALYPNYLPAKIRVPYLKSSFKDEKPKPIVKAYDRAEDFFLQSGYPEICWSRSSL